MATRTRTYRFRMCPSQKQEQTLVQFAGARRWVWNWALARKNAYYEENKQGISAGQLSAELTALKSQPETAWLQGMHAGALQQVLRDLFRTFQSFFRRHSRFPKFKSKKRALLSFRIPQRVKIANGKVYVPKIGWIRIRQSRDVEGVAKSATFKQDACGHWYVLLVAAFEIPDEALPPPNPVNVVGMDAGLKTFLVLSNGERVETPKFYRKAEKKLCKSQRVMRRRDKESNRRDKARKRFARIHRKVTNQRLDFLHKTSTDIIRRFDGVCVESLRIKRLAKTKRAKSFYDAAHYEFCCLLEYKALWNRKRFVKVGRFYPSTKMCSGCIAINDGLTLADRQWVCSSCGLNHDRDLNAAINIKTEGLRLIGVPQGMREFTLGESV